MSETSLEATLTRRQRREQRSAQRREEQLRRQRNLRRWTWIGAAVVALLVTIGGGAWWLVRDNGGGLMGDGGAVHVADQGREHVNPGQQHVAYNSTPPTSGPHFPNWASWGVKSEPLPNELQIHNLEHGGIMVQYNCQAPAAPVADCAGLINQLQGLASSLVSSKPRIIVAPYPNMEHPVALTAWDYLLVMDRFDRARALAFINTHYNRAPEDVP